MVPGISELVEEMAAEGYSTPQEKQSFKNSVALAQLKKIGSELWLDTGDLEKARSVWHAELSALTTNNTLANQVVQSGVMDGEIQEAITEIRQNAKGLSEEDLIKEIGFLVNCRIALRLIEAFGVKVSVELHPDFARDKEMTLTYARRYYQVCPSHFIVKIPLTPEGLLAVRELSAEGIPINFTLGFSARQNYLAARFSNPTYSNVFLGRLNAVVNDNKIGKGKNIGERVMVSAQRIVSELRQVNDETQTQLIGASIRSGEQIHAIAGTDVLTIPPAALESFLKLNYEPSVIVNQIATDYPVTVNADSKNRVSDLWEVDEDFRHFVDLLMTMKHSSMTGNDLVTCCEQNGINLFHRFTDGELAKIQSDGKIPVLAHWDPSIAIDDLMTQSALQSFAVDQTALDNRIRNMLS